MGRSMQITGSMGNILERLGTMYATPVDALKEHVSNALDEHVKVTKEGGSRSTCDVEITLEKSRITIEYPYGMTEEEFRGVLTRVADSAKRGSNIQQIGRLGIGIFGYQQIGKKCTFLSKKGKGFETVKVVLRKGSDEAEFPKVNKSERLETSGIRVIISGLELDPLRNRGKLSRE